MERLCIVLHCTDQERMRLTQNLNIQWAHNPSRKLQLYIDWLIHSKERITNECQRPRRFDIDSARAQVKSTKY